MLTLKRIYRPLLKKTGLPAKTTFIFQKFGLYTEKLLLDALIFVLWVTSGWRLAAFLMLTARLPAPLFFAVD
jgi:hypothetical protein